MTLTITPPPMDFLAGTTCQLLPHRLPWGPGWYLVADNGRVEGGPFATPELAADVAAWLDEHDLGVHPAPWSPRWSDTGLLVGSRVRDERRKKRHGEELALTG